MNELTKPAVVQAVHRNRAIIKDAPAVFYDQVGGELMPECDCQAILGQDEHEAMNTGQAVKLARHLASAYPRRPPSDPETYASMLTLGFDGVSYDDGLAAFDYLTKIQKFPPVRADVEAACRVVIHRRFNAIRVAKAHLREHDRRKVETAQDTQRADDRSHPANDAWLALPMGERPRWAEFRDNFGKG